MFRHSSHQLLDNPPALHYGAAAVDVDGDGLFEVVVAGFLGPCLFFDMIHPPPGQFYGPESLPGRMNDNLWRRGTGQLPAGILTIRDGVLD